VEERSSPPSGSPESHGTGGAKQAASQAAQETKQVARTAGEQAGEVTGTAEEQAAEVVSTAKEQGRSVARETKEQLRRQARSQGEQLAQALRRVGEQVQALAEGRADDAGKAGDYARQAASTVNDWAGRVESQGLEGFVRDLEGFARRRPGMFLGGAAAAGFLVGRVIRGARGGAAPPAGGDGQERRELGPQPALLPSEPVFVPETTPGATVPADYGSVPTGASSPPGGELP
jgi:hypothetical protein